MLSKLCIALKRLTLLAVCLLSFLLCVFPQQISVTQSQNRKKPQSLIRKSGWTILGIESYSNNFDFIDNMQVKGVNVRLRSHSLATQRTPISEFELYDLNNGILTISIKLTTLQSLISYEVDGKIFAYTASYTLTDSDLHGFRTYFGAMYRVTYYDDDGNGIFETREDLSLTRLPSSQNLLIQEKPITTITRKNSWNVPGDSILYNEIGLVTIDGVRLMKSSNKKNNEKYDINKSLLYNIETYSLGEEGQIIITDTLCAVKDIFFYEAEIDAKNMYDNRFAQEVYLQPVSINENWVRTENGKPFVQFYYDDSKNAVSRTRYDGETTLRVPDWVKQEIKKRKSPKAKKQSLKRI